MESNTAISLASAFVAVSALFVSIWNCVATRRHNRISVRPNLSIHRNMLSSAPQLTLSVRNDGLGTAIIDRISVYVDNVEQPLARAIQWKDIVSKLRIFDGEITGYAMLEKETLRPGDTRLLVSIEDTAKDYDPKEIQAETSRLKIIISYLSMYGEKFTETL